MEWFKTLNIQQLFITKGSPWENGYCESFNGKMRYELLSGSDSSLEKLTVPWQIPLSLL